MAGVSAVIALLAWLFPRQPGGTATPPSPSVVAQPFTVNVAVNQNNCEGATMHHVVPAALAGRVRPYHNVMVDASFVGAADAVYSDVIITLQGTSTVATVLQDMRIRVVRRDRPAGVVYQDNAGQCGGITPAYFGVDLDQPTPKAKPLAGDDGPARPFPFTISESDPEVFHVFGVARGCDCRWFVDIVWFRAGVSGTTTISDQGEPFRTVGTEGLPVFDGRSDGGWRPATGPLRSPLD